MPERKISDDNNYWGKGYYCRSPEHLPATMVVRSPGTYEHTCPNCGFKTVFEVPPAPSMTEEQKEALNQGQKVLFGSLP